MGVQHDVASHGGDVLERLGRDREPVADAAAVDHHVVPPAHRDLAGDERDHVDTPATARASGEWLR
jgi:hypothetical protein